MWWCITIRPWKSVILPVLLNVALPAPAAHSLTLPHNPGQQVQRLGTGVDAPSRTFRRTCIGGDTVYAGGGHAEIGLGHRLSKKELKNRLQGSFEAGVNLILASGSARTELTSALRTSRYQETWVYEAAYQGPTVHLQSPHLSTLGAQVRDTQDPEHIALNCGQRFVNQIKLGGRLYFIVRFNFRDESLRNDFVTRVSVKILGFTKTKTIRDSWDLADASTSISIEAVQFGGDDAPLKAIINNSPRECSLNRLEDCENFIDSLFNYATGSGPTDFPTQMQSVDYARDGQNLAVLGYQTASYREQGFQELDPKLSPFLEGIALDAAERIGEIVSDVESDRQRAQTLLHYYPQSSMRHRQLRRFHDEAILPLRDRAIRALLSCDRAPLRCLNQEAELVNWRDHELQYSPEILNQELDFLEICFRKVDFDNDAPLVNALLSAAGSLDCEYAAKWLATATSLQLRDRGLMSVRALLGASRLHHLDVRENQIKDLRPLGKLPLKTLNIAYNKISQVGPLRSATNLVSLLAYGNPVVDFPRLPTEHFTLILRTENELCEWQRRTMLAAGIISEQQYQAYLSVDLVPRIVEYDLDLKPCSVVAKLVEP